MKKAGIMLLVLLVLVAGCDLVLMKAVKGTESQQEIEEHQRFEEIGELIGKEKTDEALKLLQKEDRTSAEYYYLMEMAYLKDGSEKANEALASLYAEAADQWQDWQHMQKMAGAAAIYEGNYQSAQYRLIQALRLDMEDGETWYYLGALSYYEGNYEDMRMYFEHALGLELSETKQQEILWFAEQAGDRG